MDTLDVYLDVLFEGLTGYVYSPVKTQDRFETHWFDYPAERARLKDHITTKFGDVYISPAVYSERRATKDAIKKLQTVWVEFDGQERIDFQQVPTPTTIIQTSRDTHVHCYWRVESANQGTVEDVNRRLTSYLKADNSGWDATQLLRPPNTTNWKHNLPVKLVAHDGVPHKLSEFEFIPQIKFAPNEITAVEELLDAKSVLKKRDVSRRLRQMIEEETPKEPHRSSFMTRLAHELAEEEFTHLEIVSLLKHVDERVGKWKDRSDQLKRLSQLADYAIISTVAEEDVAIYTPEYILNHVESLNWILPNWLHTHGFMMIAGAPNVGKTQLLMQLAYCLSEGERFLGIQAPTKQKVMVWSLEMDIRSLKYILEHQRPQWQRMPEFIVIDEETSWSKYEDMIDQNNIQVILIDSLTELYDDSLPDKNAEAARVMKWCRKVRRRYNCAVVMVHHTRKPTEGNKKPKTLADLIGSQEIQRVVETAVMLWDVPHKGHIELSAVKARFGMKGEFGTLVRNQNLWYERQNENSENDRRSTDDSESDSRQQGTVDRPGMADDGKAEGKDNPGIGFKFGY